jgi:isopenicillin-N N-acyltransferase-like protein
LSQAYRGRLDRHAAPLAARADGEGGIASAAQGASFGALTEVSVAGTAFERGRLFGAAASAQIGRLLGDGAARIEWVCGRAVDRSQLSRLVRAHASIIESHLPHIADEIHGLAAGAAISIDDAYLLQCRREAIHDALAGGCTTMASAEAQPYIAQTIDLPGRLAEFALMLRTQLEERTILQLTFAGLLGYVGINDKGLAIGLNMIIAGDWRPGIPPYLISRRLLELETVEEGLEELRRLPRASSRCYTLVDPNSACQVETTPDELVVLDGPELLHTNHCLSGGISDSGHVLQRRESRRRFERLSQEFPRLADSGESDEEQAAGMFAVLSCHGEAPICIHGDGDPRRPETVAAVVMQTSPPRVFARRGNPCCAPTQTFEVAGGSA